MTPEKYMKEALKQAKLAVKHGEVPVGAVIVYQDKIIARGYNKRKMKQQTVEHAEMDAIRKACRVIGSWRLEDCDMYVTLEPCPMCAGAILQARMRKVYYGADDPKAGVLGSLFNMYEFPGFNHYPEVEKGILYEECSTILKEFFKNLRARNTKERADEV